jgi:predicted RNA-binding Zn ribbon-like protein
MAAKDVPAELRLVESFANSVDVDTGQDDLDSTARFERWLEEHGFAATSSETELDLARQIRAALRDDLVAHHGSHASEAEVQPGAADADARARLDALSAEVPLRASFGAGPAGLAPMGVGVTAMLGEVLASVVVAEREGVWPRLKICREDTCQWVYYDRSKNASKTWCSMQVCGNRNKTRAYRGRRKQQEGDSAPTAASTTSSTGAPR